MQRLIGMLVKYNRNRNQWLGFGAILVIVGIVGIIVIMAYFRKEVLDSLRQIDDNARIGISMIDQSVNMNQEKKAFLVREITNNSTMLTKATLLLVASNMGHLLNYILIGGALIYYSLKKAEKEGGY